MNKEEFKSGKDFRFIPMTFQGQEVIGSTYRFDRDAVYRLEYDGTEVRVAIVLFSYDFHAEIFTELFGTQKLFFKDLELIP